MDASVAGAVITSAAALVVAVGGAIRSDLRVATGRRYERRQAFLVEAQDAALDLRDALRAYGAALQQRTADAGPRGGPFRMSVPPPLEATVAAAEGRVDVARSRLEDDAVVAALDQWHGVARKSLIDVGEVDASVEAAAFDELNVMIGAALRSAQASHRGRSGRRM